MKAAVNLMGLSTEGYLFLVWESLNAASPVRQRIVEADSAGDAVKLRLPPQRVSPHFDGLKKFQFTSTPSFWMRYSYYIPRLFSL